MRPKLLAVIAFSPIYFKLTQISGSIQIRNSYCWLHNNIKIPLLKIMFRAKIVNYM